VLEPMSVRAIRGATTLDIDDNAHLGERAAELLAAVLDANRLTSDDVISVLVTASADIRSGHPATALRRAGLDDVPILGAQELDLPGMLPRCVRLMFHVETSVDRADLQHVYLHRAVSLRPDLVDARAALAKPPAKRRPTRPVSTAAPRAKKAAPRTPKSPS
jgi:chorismate mutase